MMRDDDECYDYDFDELEERMCVQQLSGTWWRVCHCGERERRPGSGSVPDDWDSVELAVFGSLVKNHQAAVSYLHLR